MLPTCKFGKGHSFRTLTRSCRILRFVYPHLAKEGSEAGSRPNNNRARLQRSRQNRGLTGLSVHIPGAYWIGVAGPDFQGTTNQHMLSGGVQNTGRSGLGKEGAPSILGARPRSRRESSPAPAIPLRRRIVRQARKHACQIKVRSCMESSRKLTM